MSFTRLSDVLASMVPMFMHNCNALPSSAICAANVCAANVCAANVGLGGSVVSSVP